MGRNNKRDNWIDEFYKRFKLIRSLEVLAWSICVGLLIFTWLVLYNRGLSYPWIIFLGLLIGFVIFFISRRIRGLTHMKKNYIISYLNRNYPFFEHSAELLLIPRRNLNSLGLLQKQKIAQLSKDQIDTIRLPAPKLSPVILIMSIILLGILLAQLKPQDLLALRSNVIESATNNSPSLQEVRNTSSPFPSLQKIQLNIYPPSYTRLRAYTQTKPEVLAPQNSQLIISLNFSHQVKQAYLVFNNQDSLMLSSKDSIQYSSSFLISEPKFYQICYRDVNRDSVYSSSYYRLEPIPDQAPQIKIKGLAEYSERTYHELAQLNFKALIQDDYGIDQAFLVATVSRGEGESVKFRESKIPFEYRFLEHPKQIELAKSLKFKDLEMQPGDELYFYIEARDNRLPTANTTRTEMFFVNLEDTSDVELTLESGSGIKVLPEYFRSQRQLIIDTEKLIAQKESIAQKVFESESNGLGIDQKILRLRYGKFLGEEFSKNMGGGIGHDHHEGHEHHDDEHEPEEDEEEYEHYEGDGHDENDPEHKAWLSRRSSMKVLERNQRDHSPTQKNDKDPFKYSNPSINQVPEDILHLHDVMEEASFLDEALRVQLKAALSNMWESELRLRTFRPKESLPFQYRALKIIKLIQQKSRLYVQRIGFDPPPIDENATRYKGELDDVNYGYELRNNKQETTFPAIREALSRLEQLTDQATSLNLEEKAALNLAGNELVNLILHQPGLSLSDLSELNRLSQGIVDRDNFKKAVQNTRRLLWMALPRESPSLHPSPLTNDPLETRFRHKRIGL